MNFHTLRTFYLGFIGWIIIDIVLIRLLVREFKAIDFKKFNLKADKFIVIMFIALSIIIAGSIYLFVVQSIKDLPYVLKGEYETVTGESLKSFGARTKGAHPGVEIKDEKTGEVITINLYYQPRINRGDRLTVNYLTNTKIGNVAGQGYFRRNK